jgi:riboflavin kinase/FMN adenylyltransferase
MKIYRHFPKNHPPCILTIGNYDGIHLGHQALINKLTLMSKNLNLESAVMTFEPHPREFFSLKDSPQRIISLREKLEFFDSKNIDRVYVIKFNKDFSLLSGEDFTDNLQNQINVKKILVGKDFRYGKNRDSGVEEIKQSGIEVIALDEVKYLSQRVSSTIIRNALADGDFKLTKELLGRYYFISGKVVHGKKIGRQLGFPTANIHIHHKQPPLSGVFAVKLDNMFGVANLGTRPTVSGEKKIYLEVHILNFSDDLYGKHVRVNFLKKIRDEFHFPTIEALKSQIKLDIQATKDFISKL